MRWNNSTVRNTLAYGTYALYAYTLCIHVVARSLFELFSFYFCLALVFVADGFHVLAHRVSVRLLNGYYELFGICCCFLSKFVWFL